MRVPFDPYRRNYRSLSDRLEAREAYQVHLMALENVFATAIGLYRIRDDAPDSRRPTGSDAAKVRGSFEALRTFANSSVKDWSWPCVLVLVKRWMSPDEVKRRPDTVAPRSSTCRMGGGAGMRGVRRPLRRAGADGEAGAPGIVWPGPGFSHRHDDPGSGSCGNRLVSRPK
jgi:hypothetical protein